MSAESVPTFLISYFVKFSKITSVNVISEGKIFGTHLRLEEFNHCPKSGLLTKEMRIVFQFQQDAQSIYAA